MTIFVKRILLFWIGQAYATKLWQTKTPTTTTKCLLVMNIWMAQICIIVFGREKSNKLCACNDFQTKLQLVFPRFFQMSIIPNIEFDFATIIILIKRIIGNLFIFHVYWMQCVSLPIVTHMSRRIKIPNVPKINDPISIFDE